MSNGSSSSYVGACRKDIPYPSVSSESVPSLIDNLVYALYGTITKSVINRRVVWNIPCDPNNTSTINGIPRNTDEGLLCYIVRALNLTTPSGFVTVNGVQTLTNKTLTSPVINNMTATGTLALPAGSITSAMIANGAIVPSDLSTGGPSWNVSGNLTATSFVGPLSGNATTATTATNIASGVAGAVPYQSAPSTTGFTAAGTSGQVLLSNGTSAPTWSTNIAGQAGSVANGSVTPAKLSTGGPSWDASGDLTKQGDLYQNGTAADYNVVSLTNTSGVQVQLNANGNSEGNIRTVTNHPLSFSTNNIPRMSIGTDGVIACGGSPIINCSTTAKAWVRFEGGGATIYSSYNVSSVTRTALGKYTINFSTQLSTNTFSVVVSAGQSSASGGTGYAHTFATTSTSISLYNLAGTAQDYGFVGVQVFGN